MVNTLLDKDGDVIKIKDTTQKSHILARVIATTRNDVEW